MPNFERDSTDLPIVDKDGNTISGTNLLTLDDVLVRIILRTDPVLGVNAESLLTSAADSPYNWALLGLVLRDIFLDEKIDALDLTTPDASRTEKGLAELANQTEGRGGTDDERIMTGLRVLDALRSGSSFAADTTRRGTVERATESEATGLSDSTRHLTSVLVKSILEHSNAGATTTKRGTVERATQSEVSARTDTTKYVTPDTLPAPSAVPDATETTEGIAELANQTEGRGGTDDERIMTSLGVLDALRNGSSFAANTTRKGTVERATQSEVSARTDTTKYVTPDTLPAAKCSSRCHRNN